jgi:hypothetical protein
VELKVALTPRPQESFWLPAHKLKLRRGTMLLSEAVKFVSWDWILPVNAPKNLFG